MSYSDAYDPLDGIAIIGMAGRFPDANSVADLWRNLLQRRECISTFSKDELEPAHIEDMTARASPGYVRARGVLADIELFDEEFFGFTPREADILDPQQRLFLQASWEALEHAGYDPKLFSGPIGVYAGATHNSYYPRNLQSRPDITDPLGVLTVLMGNQNDYIATRVAYKFDLKGPALNIQNACSTSLVAVCTAVQALQSFQCDMALAGGVSIQLPQKRGYLHQEGSILSPDGHCRPFDSEAAGTVFSNGLGVVVLRRLRDALEDGDTIYAIIKGAALNNDGNAKVSFTAPSVDGHAQVISMAQASGGIDPATISYIEAHGTGTSLGDPIEIAGLTQAFRAGGANGNGFCAIGSLKSNIGHLDVAAGVAGLIKATLSLHNKILPASLNFHKANPKLNIESSPFLVNAEQRAWPEGAVPRRAGVSSFGVGGTNAHVVLEEAPPAVPTAAGRAEQVLVLSARDETAVDQATVLLKAHLEQNANLNMGNVAFTLQMGRRGFNHRRAFVCRSQADAIAVLGGNDPKRAHRSKVDAASLSVGFMFPGQGAQYVNMGRTLYESEPRFREEIDACAKILLPHLGVDLRSILYPESCAFDAAKLQLTRTSITQPALFAIEYALAQVWLSWGIVPVAMIGHSVGEYVAACLGGTFTRDDALTLLAKRAQLMQEMPAGSMLAVRAPVEQIREFLGPRTVIAALNAPRLTVVSGENAAIAELILTLDTQRIVHRVLPTSHAFHSPMMEPILPRFIALVRDTPRQTPRMPWVSSLTGAPITDAQATDPTYWARQLREPVRFTDGVRQLIGAPLALLEVGPGQALTSLARQHCQSGSQQLMVTSLHPGQEYAADVEYMLAAAGQFWTRGITMDWRTIHGGGSRQRVPLPTYPFQNHRRWVEPDAHHTLLPLAIAEMTTEIPMTHTAPDTLIQRLQGLFADLSGIEVNALDPNTGFMELGLDSLFLTQASTAIHKEFGTKISIRSLYEDCSTIGALAAFLAPTLLTAPVAGPSTNNAVTMSKAATAVVGNLSSLARTPVVEPQSPLANVFAQQLAIISRQLDMISGQGLVMESPLVSAPNSPKVPPSTPAEPTAIVATQSAVSAPVTGFGPYRPPSRGPTGGLTEVQERNLKAFIAEYNRKTNGSKQSTAQNRAQLSDPRSVSGFRQVWKELVYPIVSVRSSGSHLWDIDGNDYVDITNGFGMILFGHNPDFIREAIQHQLNIGIEIGPQTPLAGEVAGLLCEMVGMQRAAFCGTGSEAVTAAIRVARTVSGRDKIVIFAGAYHGIFDEVLVRSIRSRDGVRATPIAPGIPMSMADNVLVLDYGTPESLRTIKSMSGQLAAVLVEPVQSRRPELQPREFLRELRKITEASDTALIFDEVVTGFRVHPGGAQALFDVRADIATYGKVIGGGLPIGMVAGSAKYLDALDGGSWSFGDDSGPEVGVTFFAGTFVRHPLALAAARAVLLRLKSEGSELQRALNLRTTKLIEELRQCIREAGAPVQLNHFASWFCVSFPVDLALSSLFFAMMRGKGVHIWEGRPCFLTLAHSDTDLAHVVNAFRTTLAEMQAADFLPGRPREARKGRDTNGNDAWFIPDPDRPGKYLQLEELER
jgi:acyl transferase domain-containing protein/glutamate-1-semialdehyde aminotransferase